MRIKRALLISGLVVLSGLALSLFQSKDVGACAVSPGNPTNIFPRTYTGVRQQFCNNNADTWLWLSYYHSGSTVHTPSSRIRIFYNWSAIAGLPEHFDNVGFQSDAARFRCGSVIRITNLNSGESLTVQKNSSCALPAIGTLPVRKSQLSSDPARFGPDKRYIDLDLSLTNTSASNAPMRVYTGRGDSQVTFMSYSEGATGSAFALWSNDIGYPNEQIEYRLRFSPDCRYGAGSNFTDYLRWFDADQGAPPQGTTQFGMTLMNLTTNQAVLWLDSGSFNFGGDNTHGNTPVTLTGGHTYEWTWYGVNRANGIQIFMPFSEVGATINCNRLPSGNVSASCNANAVLTITVSGTDPDGGTVYRHVRDYRGTPGLDPYESFGHQGTTTYTRQMPYGDSFTLSTGIRDAQTGEWVAMNPASIPITCPSLTQQTLSCSMSGTTPAILNPGDSFTVTFTITHQGGSPSQPAIVDPAYTNRYVIGAQGNSGRWGPARLDIPSNTTADGRPALAPGTSVTTVGTFTVPADVVAGSNAMNYAVLQEGVRWINYCSTTVNIKSNRPLLRIDGSDVLSGSTFGTDDISCSAYPFGNANAAHVNTHGYFDYASTSINGNILNGQSSSQYAALASGRMGNSAGANTHFATNNAYKTYGVSNQIVKDLAFANRGGGATGTYGELYGTNNAAVPCYNVTSIDRLSKSATNAVSTSDLASAIGASGSRSVISVPGGLSNTTEVTVPTGKQLIIVVNGDLNIGSNIRYSQAASSYGPQSSVPYLMIIAKGGITISSGVTNLDGHYVSLHSASRVNSGTIDTCSNNANAGAYVWSPMNVGSCNSRLEVNGSLAARRVLWKRTSGTTGNTTNAANAGCAVNSGVSTPESLYARLRACSSERINFSPEAYLANPLSVSSSSGAGSVPITTTEAPPVY